MSSSQENEHDAWWPGYRVATETAVDLIKRHMTENPNITLKDLVLRIKVNALTQHKSLADE